MPFKDVDTKLAFPALELSVAQWWKERGIIKQALESGDQAHPFIFFEGPPTANGRPGVHHVEARVTKDLIVRYQRMRGRHVIGARGGWDTHGLPVEVEVEKELGFKGKPDIEKYGIKEFNAKCKESVNRYVDEFERLTDRIAFWLDLDDPYKTYNNSYIESLWWILRQLWDRDLLFRDYKVTMHCPRCGTTLADAEVALGFEEDVDDPSVWLRFRHRPSGHALDAQLADAAFVAWTTTPWTLPANVALAVNPAAAYVLVALNSQPPLPSAGAGELHSGEGERVILAEALAEQVLENIPRKKHWIKYAATQPEELEITCKRIDPAPGTHSVLYTSAIDDIEIIHTAHNRTGFATGAVLAAEFIKGKKGIFSMKEVLGF